MNDGENKVNDVNSKNDTSARTLKILTGALIVVAASTAVAFYLLFAAKSDIDELQSKNEKIEASSESSSSKTSTDIEGLQAQIKKIEDQIKAKESETKKAKDEFDPDKPFGDGDASVTSMLKTIDLNADTANENFAKIEAEVSRLKGQLNEEKQVAGD